MPGNFADSLAQKGNILHDDFAGFCQIIEQVFHGDQRINDRYIGLRERGIILHSKFGAEQAELLQWRSQFFQTHQGKNRAVMQQLFGSITPGLFLLDRFDVQHFLAQRFKKAFALFARIADKFFNFQLAGMGNLHLHRIGIIICRRCCLRFWQLLQRFLYQD